MVLRVRTIICGDERARDGDVPKNDDYHIKSPNSLAASAARNRENHGLTRCPRKYASRETSTLRRFTSV
jgi:hypothetical protein